MYSTPAGLSIKDGFMDTECSDPERAGGGELFQFEVTFPVEESLLAMIRRFVCQVSEDMDFNKDEIYKIELAVDEACSNVMLHAYGEAGTRPLIRGQRLPCGWVAMRNS
jgi:hypothetical protein